MTEPRFPLHRSLLYSAILILMFFGLLEGTLRIVGVRPAARPRLILRSIDIDISFPFMRPDRDLFWSPRPGWAGTFMGQPVTISSLGLRGPEPGPRTASRRRVACFGDSVTFGYGVGDDDTYPAQLGRLLQPQGFEVVNAGVTGYTTYQVLGLLARVGPELRPDVATFCIGWNDATLRPLSDREYAGRLHSAMAVEGALDRLYLYRAARSLYTRAGLVTRAGAARRTARVPIEEYEQNLRRLARGCREAGVEPVFVALPRRRRAGEAPYASEYPLRLRETARAMGVRLVVAGTLVAGDEPNDGYFLDTLHFTASGNGVMAEALARALAAPDPH